MKIKIVVAAHKNYSMPEDGMYLPVHVGHALADSDWGWQGDDTGDNISARNPSFCELTALYWAWKNLDADAIGLAQYRRHFLQPDISPMNRIRVLLATSLRWSHVLTADQAARLLESSSILLPSRRHYFIESIESQFVHAHGSQALECAREAIAELSPSFCSAFEMHMEMNSGHICNMFIMRRDCLDKFCSWLFNILFYLDDKYSLGEQPRLLGFIGERLLDTWILGSESIYTEIPSIFMERQNWLKKGANFVYRKIKNA